MRVAVLALHGLALAAACAQGDLEREQAMKDAPGTTPRASLDPAAAGAPGVASPRGGASDGGSGAAPPSLVLEDEPPEPRPPIDFECGEGTGAEEDSADAGAAAHRFVALTAGSFHTCGLHADGSVRCWGMDLGEKHVVPRGRFTQLSTFAKSEFTYGLRPNGCVARWGPAEVPPLYRFQTLASDGSACGVRPDGAVYCWGRVGFTIFEGPFRATTERCGIREDGRLECRYGSVPPAGSFTALMHGAGQSCALRENGEVACWGNNEHGEASPPEGRFVAISAGSEHTCGIREEGEVVCWGSNEQGQSSPPSGIFLDVAAGGEHTCALAEDGSAVCWGSNDHGQALPP